MCPEGSVCTVLASFGNEPACAEREQLAACEGHAQFESCGPERACFDGVCLDAGCGNGRQEPDEVCDDRNRNAGDGCSSDCRSNETCRNGAQDLVNFETCDDGNALGHDGCASACGLEAPRWDDLLVRPRHERGAAVAYDTKRRETILFGGFNATAGLELDEMWSWDGVRWTRRNVFGPVARSFAAAAYDAARDRVVLFGGDIDANTTAGDTWLWDGQSWQEVVAPGPHARGNGKLVYDAARKRTILFGGNYSSLGVGNVHGRDTWAFDGTSWSQVGADLPSELKYPALGYDARRGVVVLVGAREIAPGNVVNEVWELSGSTWTERVQTGPSPRYFAALAWNALTQRLHLSAGTDAVFGSMLGDAWEWDGATWTQVADAPTANIVTAGLPDGLLAISGFEDFVMIGSAWQSVGPATRPDPRYAAGAALDPRRGRVVLFGGRTGSARFDDTWEYAGSWTKLAVVGPSGRANVSFVYDVARDQFVLFGGWDVNLSYLPETWILDASGWRTVAVSATPSPRRAAAMAFDEARGNAVLFGGSDGSVLYDDTWLWTGTTWTPLAPSTKPGPRAFAGIVYDPVRQRSVLFGGLDPNFQPLDDTWEWDGANWIAIATPTRPPGRACTLAWDAARKRVILVAGGNGTSRNDVWDYDGTTWSRMFIAEPMRARFNQVTVGDPRGAGILSIAGIVENSLGSNETLRLRLEGTSGDEQCTSDDGDGDSLVGCADPDCWSICTPLCAPGAATCTMTGPRCGDGTCDQPRESCRTCASDCACAAACGDLVCNAGETITTCIGDCTP